MIMHSLLLFCAKYLVFVAAVVAGAYWLTLPTKLKIRTVIYAVIIAVTAGILAKLGAILFYDPRPFVSGNVTPLYTHGADNGFPSDHTLLAGFIAATILSVSRKWAVLLFAFALAIGLARVFGHIHHLIDIIGSLLFVAVGYGLATLVAPLMEKNLRKVPESSDK